MDSKLSWIKCIKRRALVGRFIVILKLFHDYESYIMTHNLWAITVIFNLMFHAVRVVQYQFKNIGISKWPHCCNALSWIYKNWEWWFPYGHENSIPELFPTIYSIQILCKNKSQNIVLINTKKFKKFFKSLNQTFELSKT